MKFKLILLTLLLVSCNYKVETLGVYNPILYNKTLYKIEYYKAIENKAFQQEKEPNFVIFDKSELTKAIEEIRNADNSEPWKGAGWNRVKLYFKDTIVDLKTNNEKIGAKNNGSFYDLSKDNFIVRNLN